MKKIRSKYGFEESVKRLKVEMEERGLTIFYEADHRKNAQEAKMALAGATVLFAPLKAPPTFHHNTQQSALTKRAFYVIMSLVHTL